MQDSRLGILVFALLALGGFLLLRRSPVESSVETLYLQPRQNTEHITGGKRYLNTEVWEIEWNSDGLPIKVEVHRDARQN